MVKVTVITDHDGKLLGAVRTGPMPGRKLAVRVNPRPGHRHHEIDVDEALMSRPIAQVHRELQRQVAGKA